MRRLRYFAIYLAVFFAVTAVVLILPRGVDPILRNGLSIVTVIFFAGAAVVTVKAIIEGKAGKISRAERPVTYYALLALMLIGMPIMFADFSGIINVQRLLNWWSPNQSTALIYENWGRSFQASGKLDTAIANYNTAIELDPRLADAYAERASAYQAKGDLMRARKDLEIAARVRANLNSAFPPN
ncbi:TPR repeat protein [Methylovirgula ligni]|uniref:TPR repeat protein n=1 Tax=Methylovirgula ligni TaxID=569860 RepID=A0A3D9Z4C0_9HYPH|nr:TPR repeat protein [Methylovirgula ligni]